MGMNEKVPGDSIQLPPVEKLTLNTREACQALGLSPTSLWRLEKRGLISSVAGIRTKLYSVAMLRRFIDGKGAVRVV
jgi:hypothetical protein